MANNRVPINYEVPSFPSLYDPLPVNRQQAYYLYYTKDIWRFTLFWTLIFYGATHLTVAGCAVLTHFRNWNVIWIVPLVYSFIAALESLLAGSIIGVVLGAVYESGNFRMSTWLPMIWGGVNVMVLIVTSFPMQGGL
ncbi:Integral membrane protein [Penicillium cf. viridicatum]|uniref:Integral membrane protein n=1 Tax=Penicillium cf. viridicatum TaxID=2972119 RepID=A0A9W9M2U6_9EURO|nr:Integral membrane protein [Penicillium cf. viridicatum]